MCNETGNTAYDGYGVINKALWGHGRFRKLDESAKLIFLYLIAGPETQDSGLFEVHMASLDDVTEYRPDFILKSLSDARMLRYEFVDENIAVILIPGMYASIKDGQRAIAAQQQALKVSPCALRDAFVREHGITGEHATEGNLGMLEAVCRVTGMELSLLTAEHVARIGAISAAGYTPEDVETAFGRFDGNWYKVDWRGLKNPPQWPTLSNVAEEIKKLSGDKVERTGERVKRDELVEAVSRLQRQNAKATVAGIAIGDQFGPQVWVALRNQHKWSTWARMEEPKFEIYRALNEAGL